MFKRIFSFLMVLLFLLVMSDISLAARIKQQSIALKRKEPLKSSNKIASNVSSSTSYGTWLWNTRRIVENPDGIINYLKENRFTEVYVQIDRYLDYKHYKYFIRNAKNNGINVYALDGNANWALKENRLQLDEFLNWVVKYNNSSLPDERFVGIHLDVEPYILDLWNVNRNKLVLDYVDYISYINTFGAKNSLIVGVDIPFWFDEILVPEQNINLAEYVISKTANVNIMAYRDKAQYIIDIVKNEMDYAKRYNTKIMISVETGNTSEGDYITFYQEGLNFMWNEINNVNEYYKNNYSNYGFALHYLENIMAMKR